MTRKPLIPHAELRRLAERLVDMQGRLARLERSSRATQLSNSSIEGGSLVIRDANGNVRGAVGMQPSGNSGVRTQNNPPPFRPNTPTVTSIPGGVAVTWNGELVNGVPDPTNFSHVDVYFSGAGPDFIHGPSNRIARLNAGGSIPITPLPEGNYYARLVAVNSDDPADESEPSLTGGPAQPGQVVADDVLDGIIDETKLAAEAVTEAKLAAGAVTETKVADDAISTPKLVAGAVQAEKIAAGAVLAEKIAAEAVTTEKLAALAVTADKIAANAIEAAHIQAGAVDAEKLAAVLVLAGDPLGDRVQLSQFNGIEQWRGNDRTLWIPPAGMAEIVGSLRVGTELQHIAIVPADEETSFPRVLFLDDNSVDRRAAMYFQFDTFLLRRETIVPDEYAVGEVRGGQLSLGLNTHLTHFLNSSGSSLGAVDLYDDGRTRILGRDPFGNELGAWDIQQLGDCWLTAQRSLTIENRGDPGGDLTVRNQRWNINFDAANDLNFDSGQNMWFRAQGDCNYEANAVFLRNDEDPNGDEFCQIALYPNGQTELWIAGESHGALVGWEDRDAFKSFVIDHPDEPEDRWLVHACIEGPTADLIYRGEAEIVDGQAVVELPGYFESAARPDGRQVQLTPVDELCLVAASRIEDGRFTIRCSGPDGTKVAWLVTAIRADVTPFDVEPRKADVQVHGMGPYRFLGKRADQ